MDVFGKIGIGGKLFIIVCLVVGAGLIAVDLSSVADWDLHGVKVTGIVQHKYYYPGRGKASATWKVQVDYKFRSTEIDADPRTWDSLYEGGPIELEYKPTDGQVRQAGYVGSRTIAVG